MAILRRLFSCFLVVESAPAAAGVRSRSSSEVVVVDILSLLGSGSCCPGSSAGDGNFSVLVSPFSIFSEDN